MKQYYKPKTYYWNTDEAIQLVLLQVREWSINSSLLFSKSCQGIPALSACKPLSFIVLFSPINNAMSSAYTLTRTWLDTDMLKKEESSVALSLLLSISHWIQWYLLLCSCAQDYNLNQTNQYRDLIQINISTDLIYSHNVYKINY